jgi:hypothetical protein
MQGHWSCIDATQLGEVQALIHYPVANHWHAAIGSLRTKTHKNFSIEVDYAIVISLLCTPAMRDNDARFRDWRDEEQKLTYLIGAERFHAIAEAEAYDLSGKQDRTPKLAFRRAHAIMTAEVITYNAIK